MKKSTRYLIVILCLLLAMACYAVGMARGTGLFLLIGFLFELAFWYGLFPKKK